MVRGKNDCYIKNWRKSYNNIFKAEFFVETFFFLLFECFGASKSCIRLNKILKITLQAIATRQITEANFLKIKTVYWWYVPAST